MSIAALANQTVKVERVTHGQDAWGGDMPTFAGLRLYKATVQPASGFEFVVAGKPEMVITHKLFFSGTPDIRSGDRIEIAGGVKLYVQRIMPITGGNKTLTKVFADERDKVS